MTINVKDLGAVGDGYNDDTAAIQSAVDDAYTYSDYLEFPAGVYCVSSDIVMPFDSSNAFNKGNYIFGAGMLRTQIKSISNNITIFKYQQPSANKFMMGGGISQMSFLANSQSNCCAIQMQALYSHQFNGLYIDGFKHGIDLINQGTPGDSDASNHLSFENNRIVNCSEWGLFSNLSTGNNENSFLSFRNSTIEGCGTTAGAIGGGMYWRGQMMQFDNCAFAANKNRGLYIEGGAGLGSNVLFNNTTFENNTDKQLQCYGVTDMAFNNLQLYSNNANVAQYGVYLNAQSLIANVRVNSAKVRASASNNPYYAFLATGANASTTTIIADSKQIRWDDWGHAGQVQYSGFTVV